MPATPEDLDLTERRPPFDEVRRRAVQEYAAVRPQMATAGEHYTALVTRILDDAGINYLSVTGRTKTVTSFAEKLTRVVAGNPEHVDLATEVSDQIGVRVITYVHSDVAAVADLLADELTVLDDRDLGQETANDGRFGYASRHVLVTVAEEHEPAWEPMHGHRASVQIRTVLQHAWAEFEHDIRYKGTVPQAQVSDLDRRFTLAAGLLELADKEFSTIRDRLQDAMRESSTTGGDGDPRIGAQELAAFLAGEYPEAGWSRTDHYAWISELVLELGLASLDELGDVLRRIDGEQVNASMAYKYPAGAVRRLDDALLAFFGDAYVDLRGNAHRTDLLRTRLAKLTS